MSEHSLDTLTQRLDRLERENRWWKITAIIVAASFGVLVLAGAESPPASDIVAKSLRIVDSQGRPAIALTTTDNGSVIWLLHEGKLRTAMMGGGDIASFELYAANGRESRVELRVDEGNNPVLLMLDPHNVIRMQLAVAKDGKPNMKLFDERKRPRAIWGMDDEGDAALALYDRGGQPVGGIAPRRR